MISNFDPRDYKDKLPVNENNIFKKGTGEGDFFKMYQDPTTLGFKLFFINVGSGNTSSSLDLKNLFKKGVDIVVNKSNNKVIDTTNTINSTGLFGNADNPNSALFYLESIGDHARMAMLMDFKSLLSKLNSEYPWYFQSIAGLNDAWTRDYSKAAFKKEITITCLESIDLRITALMDLYRKIAYDWNNRRSILPENLRKFDLSIKVYDMRNIKKLPNSTMGIPTEFNARRYRQNASFLGQDYTDTTQITFNLSHCEFLPDESGTMISNVSNVSYEQAVQSIKIAYENIEEDNIYRSLVSLGNNSKKFYYVKDYLNQELLFLEPGSFDKELAGLEQSRAFGSLIDNIAANVSGSAANLVKSKLTKLLVGNVYGFSPLTIGNTLQNNIINAPANLVKKIGNNFR